MIQKKKFPAVINKDLPYNENPVASDALNITNLGNDERSARDVAPILGNYPAFDLGSVSQQNKIYRILIPATGTYQVTVKATDNSTVLFTANFSDILTAIVQINIQAAGSGNNANITSGSGFIDIELLPNPAVQAYRWYMTSTGTDELTIQVRQEAIEPTLAGELVDIGGFDLLGDLFIWSSSQRNLPTELSTGITGATNASPIVITLVGHGLVSNQWVLITGVNGNTAANGNWSVQAINANTFSLVNSTGNGAYTGGGVVTIYPSGIGEIGVAQKNMTTLEWTYIRLLRSVEWNFRTKKQIDTHSEQSTRGSNHYWTDDYNVPRVWYYRGAYSQDGGLSFNGGLYEYDSINSESQLMISDTPMTLSFVSQAQVGGALKAGNKRYTVRALTESATATNFLELSNPVNVFSASTLGDPTLLIGNLSGDVTTKINTFQVDNIPVDIFKYLEFAVVEYFGTGIVGSILKRVVITGPSMTISHNGLETDVQELDIATVQGIANSTQTAKNIRAIDNRLILSNLTSFATVDLSEWTGAFRHELLIQEKPRLGAMVLNSQTTSNTTLNEYQQPANVFEVVGYTHNERYRFGAYVDWKGGGRSEVFWVDDITFNTDATTPDGRRIAGLPNYAISTDVAAATQAINIAYVQFSNFNPDFLVNGQRIVDLIDNLHFVRVDLNDNQKEVVATGVVVLGVSGQIFEGPFNTTQFVQVGVSSSIIDYPYIAYKRNPAINPYDGVVTSTPPTYPDFFTPERRYCSFYSPDILYGNTSFNPQNYTLKVLRQPQNYSTFFNFPVKTNGLIAGKMTELGGYFPDTSFLDYDISEGQIIPAGGSATIAGSTYSKYLEDITGILTVNGVALITPRKWNNMDAMVLHTTADIQPTDVTVDSGIYYAQIYISRPDKFGDIANSVYVPTGAAIASTNITSTAVCSVFGGDTFVQKTFLKERIPVTSNTTPPTAQIGMGTGWSFYSQNRVNAQMKYLNGTIPLYPVNIIGNDIQEKTSNWLESVDAENYYYDQSYNIQNQLIAYAAFDANAIQIVDMPTRFIWSNLKPQNSLVDNYRYFLPLNFQDADNSFGEVSHMENFNGELFALQVKKWLRMFFNTRGILQIQSVADVVIGDGSVMSRPGITISNFGCSNKWSAFKGKSKGGNDVMYWWDNINKMFMRFGSDGTLSISEIKGLEAFAANSLMWVIANDTPADGSGIHGVFHQRFGEAIWIVRAKRIPETGLQAAGIPFYWFAGTYQPGVVVFYDDGSTPAFNQSGNFYRNLTVNNTTVPGTSPNWELIPRTDVNYWSEFSIAFNEKLNEVTQGASPSGFATYYSPLPFIAHEWNNGYISPRPISPKSLHFEHNRGEYLSWYRHQSGLVVTEQTNEAYVEVVINEDTDLPKLFLALVVNSLNPPFKVSFYTQGHESFVLAADWENMNNVWQCAVRNDILTSVPVGLNNQDTTQLFGTYLRVRFHFTPKQYNSVSDFVMKFNALYRNYTG